MQHLIVFNLTNQSTQYQPSYLRPSLIDQFAIFQLTFPFLGSNCPAVWDGWLCWPDTIAGEIAYQPCPELFNFDTSSRAKQNKKNIIFLLKNL
jgi:hypothetical protein